jgi:hypothetical protein
LRNGGGCCQGADGNQHGDHCTAAHRIHRNFSVGSKHLIRQLSSQPAAPSAELQLEHGNARVEAGTSAYQFDGSHGDLSD